MIIAIVLACLGAYAAYHGVRFLVWLKRLNDAVVNVPPLGKPHWLFGNLAQIRADGGFVASRGLAFNRLGVDTIKAYLGPVPVIVTRDIEFFKFVHANQTNSEIPFVRISTPMLSHVLGTDSLVTKDGDGWAFDRKNMTPLFKHQTLAAIYDMVVDHSNRLSKLWETQCLANGITKTADIDHIDGQLRAFSTGVIAYLCFKSDIGVLHSEAKHPMVERFCDIASSLEVLSALPPIVQNIPFIPVRRKLNEVVAKADVEMLETIKGRRSGPQSSGTSDLLDLLMDPAIKPPYKDSSIRDHSMTMYWAGQESTSLFMTWALYFLAKYPQYQERLFKDLSDLPDNFTYEDLNRVQLLTNFLNETLRLTSVAPTSVKQSSSDQAMYNGLRLPTGLWIVFSLFDINRNPKYWPNPLEFNPDRWERPGMHSHEAFVPFTKGEKICIGQRLAIMEGKIVVANAVRRFCISETPGFHVAEKVTFMNRPVNGMKLRISIRS